MDHQSLILLLSIASVIIVGLIATRVHQKKIENRIADVIENGRYTSGQVVAVKPTTKHKSEIDIYLSYRDPTAGNSNLVRHAVNAKSKKLPLPIRSAAPEYTIGGPDKDGYVKLAEPVDVDVYLHDSALSGDGIYVVFRASSEHSVGR